MSVTLIEQSIYVCNTDRTIQNLNIDKAVNFEKKANRYPLK